MSEPLYWTRTKPNRPGWWLWRNKPERGIAEVQQRENGLWYRLPQHTWCGIENMGANVEWSSEPIQWPSEPPEHELVRELRSAISKMNNAEWHASYVGVFNDLADKLQATLTDKP